MQQPLWTYVPPESGKGKHLSIQEAFEAFHQANPWVCRELERLAGELISRGRKRVGLKMLTEVIRWQYYRQTVDVNSTFKINNNYTSRYARLLIEQHPSWRDRIETRRLLSE